MKKNSDNTKKKKKNVLLRLVLAVFFFCFAVCGCVAYRGYEMYRSAISELSVEDMAENIRSREDFTPIEEIPDFYIDSLIAVEDQSFFEHNGINPISIFRAVITNVQEKRLAQGGSTITQQLAKNQYFTQEKSFVRKAAEVFMVDEIESDLTKNEILELYINTIYYGDNCYSIGSATEDYFGKSPSEMDKWECTYLVGIPNAPSVYSPRSNPIMTESRQDEVLAILVSTGTITEDEKREILNEREIRKKQNGSGS